MLGIGWETGPGVFLAVLGLGVVGSAAPLLFSFGLKYLVDGSYFSRSGEVAVGFVVVALALAVVVATPSAERWATPRIRERSIAAMQRRLLRLSVDGPGLDHFERSAYWDRLQLLKRNFADLLMATASLFVGPLIALQLLVTAVVLARLEPWLLLLPAVGLPAAWLSQRAENLKRAGDERAAEPRRALTHLFTLASSARSAKEIRAYGLADELTERHRRLSRQVQRTMERAQFRAAAVSSGSWVAFGIGYVAAVVLALRAAGEGRISPGDVALTLSLATALVASAGYLSDLAGMLLRAVAVSENYFWLVDRVSAAAARVAPAVRMPVPDRLERGFDVEEVTFGYAGGEGPALDGVTLRLPAGAVVAVVGENGAGKTTLVKLLSRMYAPSSGRILADGVDLQRFDVDEYRRRLSAGFQDFVRFELVTRESVGIGDLPRLDRPEAVAEALSAAGAGFADRLPDGLETQLGRSWDGGVDLSGGEWQKLALARAMMRRNPFLVVFDEPTSALDPQTEHALFERIAADSRSGAADGRVTVLVSHRFSTVRMADLIVVLEQGRLLERGSHAQLMARGGLYSELYDLQAGAYAS